MEDIGSLTALHYDTVVAIVATMGGVSVLLTRASSQVVKFVELGVANVVVTSFATHNSKPIAVKGCGQLDLECASKDSAI